MNENDRSIQLDKSVVTYIQQLCVSQVLEKLMEH
jgi:hypothetical protein